MKSKFYIILRILSIITSFQKNCVWIKNSALRKAKRTNNMHQGFACVDIDRGTFREMYCRLILDSLILIGQGYIIIYTWYMVNILLKNDNCFSFGCCTIHQSLTYKSLMNNDKIYFLPHVYLACVEK